MRLMIAICIVLLPTLLAAQFPGISVQARTGGPLQMADLWAGLLGFALCLCGGAVARRYAFVGVAVALHAVYWGGAFGFLHRVSPEVTLGELVHWNAAPVACSIFSALAGAWLGVRIGLGRTTPARR
ncbi:hypothetical protein [Stenotrophomonas sp.]|uniref:hypothetical protein n=1 Tax=Stenotrophomonas sp. TaxID=69392 RepID=UPI0013102A67|nr:hypothetical protein [Stenotrophomonas sp.]MBD3825850.1 hypothetical protein [Stenotrophomonas sp.]